MTSEQSERDLETQQAEPLPAKPRHGGRQAAAHCRLGPRRRGAFATISYATISYAAASALTVLGLVLLTACATGTGGRVTRHDGALRQLSSRPGAISWDGIRIGMTRAQVERALGHRLPILGGRDELCGYYSTHVTHMRSELDLAFSGTTESARLVEITLHLPGGFDRAQVLPPLESRLGPLKYEANVRWPTHEPTDDPYLLYITENAGFVLLVESGRIVLGEVCAD